jgi:hypothetical protein
MSEEEKQEWYKNPWAHIGAMILVYPVLSYIIIMIAYAATGPGGFHLLTVCLLGFSSIVSFVMGVYKAYNQIGGEDFFEEIGEKIEGFLGKK